MGLGKLLSYTGEPGASFTPSHLQYKEAPGEKCDFEVLMREKGGVRRDGK